MQIESAVVHGSSICKGSLALKLNSKKPTAKLKKTVNPHDILCVFFLNSGYNKFEKT